MNLPKVPLFSHDDVCGESMKDGPYEGYCNEVGSIIDETSSLLFDGGFGYNTTRIIGIRKKVAFLGNLVLCEDYQIE